MVYELAQGKAQSVRATAVKYPFEAVIVADKSS
jgi:hypothetical protein